MLAFHCLLFLWLSKTSHHCLISGVFFQPLLPLFNMKHKDLAQSQTEIACIQLSGAIYLLHCELMKKKICKNLREG